MKAGSKSTRRSARGSSVKAGDPVFYERAPSLYGEMEVAHIRKDGRLVCIIDPDARCPSFEVFDVAELTTFERMAA